jgi:hypothetical protein
MPNPNGVPEDERPEYDGRATGVGFGEIGVRADEWTAAVETTGIWAAKDAGHTSAAARTSRRILISMISSLQE